MRSSSASSSPGERLPSEAELARRFGVALITAREGLGILRRGRPRRDAPRPRRRQLRHRIGRARTPPGARAAARPVAGRTLRPRRLHHRDRGRVRRPRRRTLGARRRRAPARAGSTPPTSAPPARPGATPAASSSNSPCSASRRGSCASRSGSRPSSVPLLWLGMTDDRDARPHVRPRPARIADAIAAARRRSARAPRSPR